MAKGLDRVLEAVEDVCQFHRYLEVIELRQDYVLAKRLYLKMEAIVEKYPRNNSLKNKLDEAGRYIWPHGVPAKIK
jgi:hypothetical protein